ncbi:hypothetical protein, partial [Oceanobacillus saliphilus]|uniref:hypothetical protein n=1 Tax=Oceanobacillus saliphilus TaxID=2925834 RepID=UPI00201D6D1B
MSIRQVFGLHKIRLQNLKAHIHLSQQHHQVDLEGWWDIQQVFKGQGAASRKMGGTEVLHQLEV